MALLSQAKDSNYIISTWKHTKIIPEILQTCSVQEYETILELAAEALKSLRQSASSHEIQDIINTKVYEIENKKQHEFDIMKKQYEYNISVETNKLQTQIRELQVQLEQSNKSYQVLHQNFHNLQHSSQETFSKSLEKAVNHVEVQHSKVEEIYKNQISTLQKQLEEYTKNAITQNVSSNKGKTGEKTFDSMVENFTTWNLEDTSKTPQSCDRFGEIRGCKTLFEIKNYSYNIPKKEVDKFKRDMEVHKDCPLGIFLSLNTNIIGAPQDFFYTEFTNSNQLLIYIQQFNNHDIESLFSIINELIDIAFILYNKCFNSEESNSLQTKVDSIKPILQMEITSITNIMKEQNNNTKFVLDTIQKHHNSLKHQLEKLQFTFKTILQSLFDDIMIVESSNDEKEQPKRRIKKKKAESIITT